MRNRDKIRYQLFLEPKLAERLEAPLRERNALLLAAGFAPVFGERGLEHPALENVRVAVGEWLAAHEPYPALAIDRRWNVVGTNAAVGVLLAGVDAELLKPPVNVLRLSLHPGGLARRILNLAEWRTHLFHRLRRELDAGGDPELAALARELEALPGPAPRPGREAAAEVLTPLVLEAPDGAEALGVLAESKPDIAIITTIEADLPAVLEARKVHDDCA